MEFNHPELDARFTIPDLEEWTILQQLRYDGVLESMWDMGMYVRLWSAAKPLFQDWECDFVERDQDLTEAANKRAVDVIKWAGLAVFSARQELDKALDEKN